MRNKRLVIVIEFGGLPDVDAVGLADAIVGAAADVAAEVAEEATGRWGRRPPTMKRLSAAWLDDAAPTD